MKKFIFVMFVLGVTSFSISGSSVEQSFAQDGKNEIILSDSELILVFSVSILVVIGIFLYIARHWFSRKKDEYEKGEFASKKNRDKEKYRSDWSSDDFRFGFSNKNSKDDEFRKNRQNSTLPDFYKILGVSHDASQDEIKNTFRRLVKEWHPDKHKGQSTEKRMSEINKAYEVLSDENTRKNYDRYFNAS